MSKPGPTLEKLPYWPRWLNQRHAAVYLGVSAGTFRTEYLASVWPGPGRRCLWDRRALDATSDRLSNLSAGTADEENGYGRDPGYIKRRIAAAYGDEEHPAPRLPAGRG